jgi:hypothetical protein
MSNNGVHVMSIALTSSSCLASYDRSIPFAFLQLLLATIELPNHRAAAGNNNGWEREGERDFRQEAGLAPSLVTNIR